MSATNESGNPSSAVLVGGIRRAVSFPEREVSNGHGEVFSTRSGCRKKVFFGVNFFG